MLLTANGPAEQLLGYRPVRYSASTTSLPPLALIYSPSLCIQQEDLPVRADHLMALDKMSLLFNYPGIEYLEALNDPTSQGNYLPPLDTPVSWRL